MADSKELTPQLGRLSPDQIEEVAILLGIHAGKEVELDFGDMLISPFSGSQTVPDANLVRWPSGSETEAATRFLSVRAVIDSVHKRPTPQYRSRPEGYSVNLTNVNVINALGEVILSKPRSRIRVDQIYPESIQLVDGASPQQLVA